MPDKQDIKASQNDLLSKWLNRSKDHVADEIVNRSSDLDEFPLSLGQQRLWFLQQLYPGNPFYHYTEAYRFIGHLNLENLLKSFHKVFERHDILRTVFIAENGEPKQRILSEVQLEINHFDLSNENPDNKEANAKEIALDESSRALTLEDGKLSRLSVIKLSDTEHLVVLTMHHIITDKWSMRIFRQEAAEHYVNLQKGQEKEFPPLEIQYADFSNWQRERKINKDNLAYWKSLLSGAPSEIELPIDRKRRGSPTFKGAFCEREFPHFIGEAIKKLATQYNTTPFVLLLAVFKLLLHRYSNQSTILIGSPITNRDKLKLENLIGFFNETIVFRSDLEGNPSFTSFLNKVKKVVLEAFEHKDVPFEVLVHSLNPDRISNVNPLFQAMFLYHKVPDNPSFGEGLKLEYHPFDMGVSKFDLTLYVSDDKGQLSSTIEYTTDLFDHESIENMQDHFLVLLEGIVKDPATGVLDYPILNKREAEKIATAEVSNDFDLKPALCLHHLFEQCVERDPEKTAVVFDDRNITYSQINQKANAVANKLLASVDSNSRFVGICTDRSFEMIYGIYGILKAGLAYVPLDPSYPVDRLSFMVKDSGVGTVIGQEKYADRFGDVDFITLETRLDDNPVDLEAVTVSAKDAAYLIYTSGSTGMPKAVIVSHENIVHSTCARFEYYPKNPDAFLLLSSFSFDSSLVGIFWTLSSGGKLVLIKERGEQDTVQIGRLIDEQKITHTLLLPSLYTVFLEEIDPDSLSSLNAVIVAGEACSSTVVKKHFDTIPGTTLYNEYGPTEATVWCTVHEISATDAIGNIPIGKPVPNARIYILNDRLQVQPDGVVGELYVGGKMITEGYLNQEELTDDRFIDSPFEDSLSEKLYKTGDLARIRKDGLIEFLGRADNQIKIRGYRVELGEIESALLQIDGIKEAVVVTKVGDKTEGSTSTGVKKLIAYVIGTANFSQALANQTLKSNLPSYMQPSSIIEVENFPRLPNGKIDLASLPDPVKSEKSGDVGFQEAQSPVEKKLAEIWADVLDFEPVSINDNFFEIGGDSILSIQIIAKARKQGIILSPNQLFEHQTIAELAQFAKSENDEEIKVKDVTGLVKLTPIQKWFFQEHKVAPHHWNQTIKLSIKHELSSTEIERAINHIVEHHDVLRMRFTIKQEKWEGIIDPPGDDQNSLKVINLNSSLEDSLGEINKILVDANKKLRLEEGGLFNSFLFTDAEGRSELYLMSHHLLVDNVSWQIIVDDLLTLFNQIKDEKELNLGNKTSSYKDWSDYLYSKRTDKETLGQLGFWTQIVEESEHLPTDFEVNFPVSESDFVFITRSLSRDLTIKLDSEANKFLNTRTGELLVTGFARTLIQHFKRNSILIGIERHGRISEEENLNLATTVGWFTSYFPLSLKIDTNEDWKKSIQSIKERSRAIINEGQGFGILKYLSDDVEVKKKLDIQPRILFNFLGKTSLSKKSDNRSFEFFNDGSRAPDGERYRLLEINASITDDGLKFHLGYASSAFKSQTMETIADQYLENLKELIEFCLEGESGSFTPSDFPEANLSQDDLDFLLGEIE